MNIILFDEFPENGHLPAADPRAHHILNVLHLGPGSTFRMGLINKSEGFGTILSIADSGLFLSYTPTATPTLYPLTLICAQVRPICMKRILREAVSLGVGRLILCGSDTGEKSYLSSNLYKTGEYRSYLLDGAMQSAHAGIPEVLFADSVNGALGLVQSQCSAIEGVRLQGQPNSAPADFIVLDNIIGSEPLSQATLGSPVVLAVGPERGWSNRERSLFSDAHFRPMLLGSRVLRTETACTVAVSLALSRMGLL